MADAGYGVDNAFRQALSDMGLLYGVGITSAVVVWPPGVEPLPPKPYSGVGRPPVMPQRTAELQPMSVKALAMSLPSQAFQTVTWREGTNTALSGRFGAQAHAQSFLDQSREARSPARADFPGSRQEAERPISANCLARFAQATGRRRR